MAEGYERCSVGYLDPSTSARLPLPAKPTRMISIQAMLFVAFCGAYGALLGWLVVYQAAHHG